MRDFYEIKMKDDKVFHITKERYEMVRRVLAETYPMVIEVDKDTIIFTSYIAHIAKVGKIHGA